MPFLLIRISQVNVASLVGVSYDVNQRGAESAQKNKYTIEMYQGKTEGTFDADADEMWAVRSANEWLPKNQRPHTIGDAVDFASRVASGGGEAFLKPKLEAEFTLEATPGEWWLVVRDMEVYGLPAGDMTITGMDGGDPYLSFQLKPRVVAPMPECIVQEIKTHIQYKTLSPRWDQVLDPQQPAKIYCQ